MIKGERHPVGRLRLLETNAAVYREMVPPVHRAAPEAVVLVVTDPPDPLADVVRGLGHERGRVGLGGCFIRWTVAPDYPPT